MDSRFLFVSTSAAGGPELFGYAVTPNSGVLTPIAGSPFSLRSTYYTSNLVASPTGSYLYATGSEGVQAFQVDTTTGVPSEISGSPFAAAQPSSITIDPSGHFLYASDDSGAGSVDAYSIAGNGALVPLQGSPFLLPSANGAINDPSGIIATGTGIYVALKGTGGIVAFSVAASTGQLRIVAGSPYAAGKTTDSLAAAGQFVYAADLTSGDLYAFSANASTGALTPVSGSPYAAGAVHLASDPGGKFLFVSTANSLYDLLVDPSSGSLSQGGLSAGGSAGSSVLAIVDVPK